VSVANLIADLDRLEIQLEAHGDRLRYSPRSAVTPELAQRMNPEGTRPPEDAVPTALLLASLPTGGPSGRFYRFMKELTVIPDLSGLDWQS